jgi:hypothetical protein
MNVPPSDSINQMIKMLLFTNLFHIRQKYSAKDEKFSPNNWLNLVEKKLIPFALQIMLQIIAIEIFYFELYEVNKHQTFLDSKKET